MSDVEVPEIPPTRLLVTDLPDCDPQKMIKAVERTAGERLRDFIYDQENNKACVEFCSEKALYRVILTPPVVMDTMMKVDIYYPWPVNAAYAYCVELCGIHTLTEHAIWKHFENARRSGGGQIDSVWIDYPRAYIKFMDKQAAWRVAYKFRHVINGVEVQATCSEKLPSSLSNRHPVAANATPVDPSEKPAQTHPSEQSTQVDPSETPALRTTYRPNPPPVLAKPMRTTPPVPPRLSSLPGPAKPTDQTDTPSARLRAPALPRDPPSSPIGQLAATDITATELTLSWQAPAHDGGSTLTGYFIEKREGVKQFWYKVAQTAPDSEKYRVTNLTPRMDYLFRVSAENKYGTSKPLVMENMVTPTSSFETPDQPVGPIVYSNITEDSVTLTWKPPRNDGGSPITGYNIEYHDVRLTTWQKAGSVGADRTTWTISTLIEDQEYVFRLFAVNAAGQSTPLETTHAAKPQRKLAAPSQPTEVQVKTIFYYSAIMTWKPPQEDGGSNITAYRVLMKEYDHEWKKLAKVNGFVNIYEVKCLKHDKKYKFAVVAENKAGTSELTETATVTGLEKNLVAPSAPVGPAEFINPQRDSVVVAWKPSEQDGGSPITGYCLEMREAPKSSWRQVTKVDADITSYCVQNLKDKVEYFFRIVAENPIGRSDALVSESITLKTQSERKESETEALANTTDEQEQLDGAVGAAVTEQTETDIEIETSDTPQSTGQAEHGPLPLTNTSTSRVVRALYPNIRVSQDEIKCSARGSCWLPDGGLLVADLYNRGLKRLNSALDVVAHLDMPNEPFAVCYNAEQREAAVSLTHNKLIQFVSLKGTGLTLSRKIKTDYECWGVVCRQDELWWVGSNHKYNMLTGVYIMDWKRGRRREKIVPRNEAGKLKVYEPRHLAVSDGVLYITAGGDSGLYIINRNGTLIRVVEDLKVTCGVCLGDVNSVFVSGTEQGSQRSTVIQYDNEGRRVRRLVTHDLLEGGMPNSLCYNGATLAVTLRTGDFVAVFHLK